MYHNLGLFKRKSPEWAYASSCTGRGKTSHYRPVQALRVPGGWGSQISWQSAYEVGKVVSPTHRPSLPPPTMKYSWYSFLLEAEWIPVRPEWWTIPMTPSGIEPATFRLVAQCLNQLHHRVPFFLHGVAHKQWTLPYRLSGNKKSVFI